MTVSSRNSNNPGGFTRKPEADLYTVMLIFALLALLIGILYLHLEMKAYDYKMKENITVGMVVGEGGRTLVAGRWSSVVSNSDCPQISIH
jgi:hypothetical protein